MREWNESDLFRLIENGERESPVLEFKRCGSLRFDKKKTGDRDRVIDEVTKDVSALANSDGGTIIYGLQEDGTIASELDDGFSPEEVVTHEWLDDIIRGNIRGQPGEIIVHAIDLTGSRHGRTALAVKVSRSPSGCQARDLRYYRRRSKGVEALEDWEIRELLGRSTHPLLRLELSFRKRVNDRTRAKHWLVATLTNEGWRTARDVRIELSVPKEIKIYDSITSSRRALPPSGFTVQEVGRHEEMARKWAFTAERPVYARQTIELINDTRLNEVVYEFDADPAKRSKELELAATWTVWADDMPPRLGEMLMSSLQDSWVPPGDS